MKGLPNTCHKFRTEVFQIPIKPFLFGNPIITLSKIKNVLFMVSISKKVLFMVSMSKKVLFMVSVIKKVLLTVKPNSDCYYNFPIELISNGISVRCQINRRSVITIQFFGTKQNSV